MARTRNKEARIVEQCARGRVTRYLSFVPVILADTRVAIDTESHILADIIDGQISANKAVFIAPCNGKVVRCYVNAITYPSTTGAATIKFTKAVIGGADVDLCATIDIDNPTAETSIDGVLVTTAGVLDLIEGQLVYAVIALSATTSVRSDGLVAGIEWVPTDLNAS